MTSPLTDTPFTPNEDVLIGWNEKRNSSSLDISRLVPFVNLLAVYDNSIFIEFTDSQVENMAGRWLPLTLQKDTDLKFDGPLKCIPMFNIMSQLNTIKQKGGEGINSLEVTRGTKESFNIRYKMGLTVMDAAVFDSRPEYTSLATLNSMFLVMYGWSGGGGKLFKESPDVFGSPTVFNSEGIKIDLEATNKGYWRAELMRLYKFDFSFDEQGFVDITAEFMSPHNALMTFIKSNDIQKDVLKLLNDKEADRAAIIQDQDIADIINSDPNLSKPTIDIIIETEVPVQRVVESSESSDDWRTRINRETEEDFEKHKDDRGVGWLRELGHSDDEIKAAFSYEKFKDTDAYKYLIGLKGVDYFQLQEAYEKWRKGQGS